MLAMVLPLTAVVDPPPPPLLTVPLSITEYLSPEGVVTSSAANAGAALASGSSAASGSIRPDRW